MPKKKTESAPAEKPTVPCYGCNKVLPDSYYAVATIQLGPDLTVKVCPGRGGGGYDRAHPPSKVCSDKAVAKFLVEQRRCIGCGEERDWEWNVKGVVVCKSCATAINRGKTTAEEKPVRWVALDWSGFFNRSYWNDERGKEALEALVRAVAGGRRWTARLPEREEAPMTVRNKDRDSSGGRHHCLYVEVDADQEAALHDFQRLLSMVGDELMRAGVEKGSGVLRRLANGEIGLADFDQYQATSGPMGMFRSKLLEFVEQGHRDALEEHFQEDRNTVHYWLQGQHEPSRPRQERIIEFIDNYVPPVKPAVEDDES